MVLYGFHVVSVGAGKSLRQHMWRYQDEQAYLYAQWLREGAENHEQNHDGGHRRLIMV